MCVYFVLTNGHHLEMSTQSQKGMVKNASKLSILLLIYNHER